MISNILDRPVTDADDDGGVRMSSVLLVAVTLGQGNVLSTVWKGVF